jgi:lysozyme
MNKLSTCAALLATACVVTTSARANNILGIDVSSAQGSINWTKVKAAGVEFAFCPATTDSSFTNNMVKGKAAGVHMGAFQFGEPYAQTPGQAATAFWNIAGPYIKADGKSLYPAITFEVFEGYDGASSYTAWFNDWATDVKAKTAIFLHPVIYASACGGMCYLTTGCGLPEWVANYNGENLYTGGPWNECTSCNYEDPGGSANWTYWQVTDTGTIGGISGDVDLDAFNGTLAELKSEEGIGGL